MVVGIQVSVVQNLIYMYLLFYVHVYMIIMNDTRSSVQIYVNRIYEKVLTNDNNA